MVEGLAQRNHSNRSREERDAGANSSKVAIPWQIRWDEIKNPSYHPRRVFYYLEKGGGADGYGKPYGQWRYGHDQIY